MAAIFNLSYFGSAKAVSGTDGDGFGPRNKTHFRHLPKGLLFFYRQWNNGNYEPLVMRGVVTFAIHAEPSARTSQTSTLEDDEKRVLLALLKLLQLLELLGIKRVLNYYCLIAMSRE